MAIENGIIKKPFGWATIAGYFGTIQDVGTICTAPIINKWSRNKPFRSTYVGFPSSEEILEGNLTLKGEAMRDAKYGFVAVPKTSTEICTPAVNFSNGELVHTYNNFQYYGPDGTTYPYRIDDFSEYKHSAVIGFRMQLDTMYYDGLNEVVFYFGQTASTDFDSRCLAPLDIMEALKDRIVGLLLTVPNEANKYFISTGKTLSELNNTLGIAYFSGQELPNASVGNNTYAIVPALANEWKGKEVTAVAVLAPASYKDASQCYNFSSAWSLCYSMEFEKDLDRVFRIVSRDLSGIDMEKLSIVIGTPQPSGTHGIFGDWHYYNNISALKFNITANTGWATSSKRIYYQLTLTEATGLGMFFSDYTQTEPLDNIEVENSISIKAGQTISITYDFDSDLALKIYKEARIGAFKYKLILSTEPKGKGLTKIYSGSVKLGEWTNV